MIQSDETNGQFISLCHSVVTSLLPIRYPGIELTAQVLGIPVRTLQRRLQSNGVSYRQLAREVRMKQALYLLKDRNIKVTEVSAVLGYTDVGSFSRAFKSWTNLSPKEYQKQSTQVDQKSS